DGTRGWSAARGHDLAGQRLDRGGVVHVERLQHDARDAELFPGAELLDELAGRAEQKAGGPPRGLAVRHAWEDAARVGEAGVALAGVAADDVGHHERAPDLRRVTPHRAAVALEDAALGRVLVARDTRGIPFVGTRGHDAQRPLLATTADDEGDAA